jgi:PKD repeat protein
MVLSAITMIANAAHIEIGTGTNTVPYIPVYTYYDYGWSEELFLQSEIGGPIEITAISYYVNSYTGTFPHTINNCYMYLSHTTQTSLTTAFPDSSGFTLVYSGGFTISQVGWNTITLDTSFMYNGVNNLLVYWENWDGDYDYPYPYFRATYAYPYRAVYRYQDGSFPAMSGYTYSYMPNVRLHYRCDNDVAVTEIGSPLPAEGYGNVPVQIGVKNLGTLPQAAFPVNVKIRDLTAPKTILFMEDFTGVGYGGMPFGWTETPYYSGSYHWGVYPYSSYAGGTSPEMRFYYYPYYTGVMRLHTTIPINTMGYSELELEFKHYLNMRYAPFTLRVQTSTDGFTWNDAWAISPGADIPATTEKILLDASNGVGSASLYLAWVVDGYSYNAYYWYIDDVFLQTAPPLIYDQTVAMTSLGVGAESQAELPDWWVFTPGLYEVTAEAQLGGDCDMPNNIMKQITQVGLVDATVNSIDFPKPLMGPAPFPIVATVENVGDIDFNIGTLGQLPVHATVLDPSGGSGLCFAEDFEGAPSFYYYEGDVNIEFNPEQPQYKYEIGDLVIEGAPGFIEWPEEKPGFGDPGDWMILNPDNNGAMWHVTDFRSTSPTQSMYCGDENTKTYLPDSYDLMISPKIHVGTSGGSFGFDIFNDVEGGSTDYVYFGASPDKVSWSWFWFSGAWWDFWLSAGGVPIFPWSVDGNGDCYIGFAFFSNSMWEYEGVYIDDVEAYGSPYLYDETVLIDLPAGADAQVEFPLFNGIPGYDDYVVEVCTEHPKDNNPMNDCASLAFNNNAPVYILENGLGFLTIQDAINAAEEEQTVVARNGTYYEDIVVNKSVTVTGEWIESTMDETICQFDHNHGSFIVGTVDIVPAEEGEAPCQCDYEICLWDDYGDGWNGGSLDVLVDGIVVLDDITLLSGSGPACYTFTVFDGSTIEILYTPDGWPYENYFYLYDSEGNDVLGGSWWPYYDGDWTGTATCPCDGGGCPCDYQICLYDDYGDGWDTYYYGGPNTLDVIVDGIVVLNDIYLSYGYGPDCYYFTVEDGSTIELEYTLGAGYYPGENYFDLWDSEGNLVLDDYYPYYSGDWIGTATCPPCASFGDGRGPMAVLQKFDINPGVIFTDEEAAVFINRSDVLVQLNTIHNVEGAGDFNVSGVQVCGDDPDNSLTNVIIVNNTIRDILNTGATAAARDTVFFEDFDSYPEPYTFDGTVTVGYWDQMNFGTACGTTYHYAEVENYKYHSSPNSAEIYYNCPNDDWLVTPVIDLSGYTNCQLDFWYMWDDSWDIEFTVYVEDQANPGVWANMKYYWLPGTSPETWYQDIISLSAYDNKLIKIAWRYTSNNEWACYIDDVLVTGDPGGGPGPGPGDGRCAALGVFEEGFLEQVVVMDNQIKDIHSMGYSYGVEYTPTVLQRETFDLTATDWIGYNDGYTEDAVYWGDPTGYAVGFTSTELTPYYGFDVTDIRISGGSDDYGFYVNTFDLYFDTALPALPIGGTPHDTFTTSGVGWDEIALTTPWTIPASGEVYAVLEVAGINGYPLGLDTTTTTPGRGGYIVNPNPPAYWDQIGNYIPGVWGFDLGLESGGPVTVVGDIVINCNYFTGIGDNTTYDVLSDPFLAPHPGVMVEVGEEANATHVTLKCNFFDNDCYKPIFAVENRDSDYPLDATLNYWGKVDGPNSDPFRGDVQDPNTGHIANGRGCEILKNQTVMFDPWIGVHALISKPIGDPITVEVGESVPFDATGSYGFCFPTCEDCCMPEEQVLQYLWDFDDGRYSSNKVAHHVFEQPGIYHVSLMIDTFGFPFHNNFMYDWDYVTVEVVEAGQPLSANADGADLGTYETTIDEPVTLYGSATGGKAPYFYSWDFGDGTSTQFSSAGAATIQHKYDEPGTYIVTLTVTDMDSNIATDESTVTVHDIEELFVSISGKTTIAQGDSITFSSTVSGGISPYTYSWNFGDGIMSNVAKPTHIYENAGTYTVTLTVTDSNNDQITKTKTITVRPTDISEVEIRDVKGGLLLKATLVSDTQVSWTIDVQGTVFMGGHAEGTAEGVTQISLPFTIAIGSVNIEITAGTEMKKYSAFALGPIFLNLQEI